MVRYHVRRARVPVERGKSVVLLPGRWRRPYHEDPRNLPIVSKLANRSNASICFYTVPFGPVPMELDETFPLAQTESFDSREPTMYEERARQVAAWVKRLSPLPARHMEDPQLRGSHESQTRSALARAAHRLASPARGSVP